MSFEEIFAAIPHRPPFLLVDEVIERDESHIRCRKRLTAEEFWFKGHYPDFPLMPGVLLCEAGMQAGAVLLAEFADEQSESVPVATRLNNVKFKQMVRPGDVLEIDVTLRERVRHAFFLDAKVSVGEKTAATFDFACTLVESPQADHEMPEA